MSISTDLGKVALFNLTCGYGSRSPAGGLVPCLTADPGGASANEEPDNQESANIAHGEEPKTHTQAMASPNTSEWLAAENYKLDQLTQLDVYDLTTTWSFTYWMQMGL
jgi:hypothetical protein